MILNDFTLFYIIIILCIINRFMIVRSLKRKETLFLVLTIRISQTAQSETQSLAHEKKNLVTFHKQK